MATKPPANIDEYLSGISSVEARAFISRIREIVREEVPEAEEGISYGMPVFKLDGGFIWFAAFKKHCSIFGTSTGDELEEKLKAFRTSKGTIQFRHDQPVPEELVRAIVRVRLRDHLAKKGK